MKNKFHSWRIVFCLLVGVLFSCSLSFAVDIDDAPVENEVLLETIYYDDGSYGEISLIEYDECDAPNAAGILATSHTKTSTKKYTYRNSSGTTCWTYRITGTFSYNGSSAKATKVTASKNIYGSGWSLVSESHYCSSNSAIGTATFKKSDNKRVKLKITCSKNGTIS